MVESDQDSGKERPVARGDAGLDLSAWERPGFLLWHATLHWEREVAAALKPLGLTHVQFVLLASVLYLTETAEVPSQRALAEHAGTDTVMTSQVVRALEARGLLNRRPDATDARVRRIVLTGRGRRLAGLGLQAIEEVDQTVFEPAGERSRVVGMLRRLARRDAKGRSTTRVSGG